MPLWRKKLLLISFLIFSSCFSFAQSELPHYPDSLFSTYYLQRVSQFRLLPYTKNDVIFLGNSITDGGEWTEMFNDVHVLNRGISGDVTKGVLNRLDDIVARKPDKVFLLIGTNDLARGILPDTVIKNILRIVSLIHAYSPATEMYVQSIFPVNPDKHIFPTHVNKSKDIIYINRHLEEDAKTSGYTFIDVFDALKDKEGYLNLHYTNDGLHLLGPGYMIWKHIVYPYVYGLQQKPSLVPLPQSLEWTKDKFPMYLCTTIAVNNASLLKIASDLKEMFFEKGRRINIQNSISDNASPVIELRIGKVNVSQNSDEAYTLEVNNNRVIITGNDAHGVFYGIQTLRQLIRDNVFIDGCYIKDWPAFSWRGYMVDVGRNFQTVKQLKQQINAMSHYKLNVFHLHLTENIAWRLQIKRYPQLTATNNMLRNKGQYYTIDEMHDLIKYCKDRFITFVPEIDMP
ncbi:MAG: family 20 glycosylhydrolase, partial [Chitinophagaceae bacterium]